MRDELRRLIGQSGETIALHVEKGAVRRYADAVGDPNPLYQNEEHVRQSGRGALVSPPGFFGWPERWGVLGPVYTSLWRRLTDVTSSLGYERGMLAGVEYHFYRPVLVGETLSATSRITDVYERTGRAGYLLFIVVETGYVDGLGRMVARIQQTTVRMPALTGRVHIT